MQQQYITADDLRATWSKGKEDFNIQDHPDLIEEICRAFEALEDELGIEILS